MNKFIAESIGTYMFVLSVLFITHNEKITKFYESILISLSFLICLIFTKIIYDQSHINFNPALTSTSLLKGDIKWFEFIWLVILQIFAAIFAYYTFNFLNIILNK